MAVPKYSAFYHPLLAYARVGLTQYGHPVSYEDAVGFLAGWFDLTQRDLEERTPSGAEERVYSRMRRAVRDLEAAGLVRRPARGRFIATELGREACMNRKSGEEIDAAFLRRYEGYRAYRARSASRPRKPPKSAA